MSRNKTSQVLERQGWLDPIANTLQQIVRTAYRLDRNGKVKDALHGKWLGHPLHAAITDLPIGAWTTAVLLDGIETVTQREEIGPGADAAIGIGLIGAVGAAATGLTDYQNVGGTARRVGIVHGVLNIVTSSFFTASFITRKRGSRTAGKALALAGLGVGMFAAKLGGELVYDHGIGVEDGNETSEPSVNKPGIALAG